MQVLSLVPLACHAVTHVLLHELACARDMEVSAQPVKRALHSFMADHMGCCQDYREQGLGCRQEDTSIKVNQVVRHQVFVLLSG